MRGRKGHPSRAKLGKTIPMNEHAELAWNGKKTTLPLIDGTAGERAIDISKLRDQTGLITLDVCCVSCNKKFESNKVMVPLSRGTTDPRKLHGITYLHILSQSQEQTISLIQGLLVIWRYNEKSDIYQYKLLSATTLERPRQKVLYARSLGAAGDLSSSIHRML